MEEAINLLKRVLECAEADEDGEAVHTSDFFRSKEVRNAILSLENESELMGDS